MQRICELRIQHGYTQEFLGKLVNCERRNISRYESGLREPDRETLIHITKALNITTDYLLCLINNPYIEWMIPKSAEKPVDGKLKIKRFYN